MGSALARRLKEKKISYKILTRGRTNPEKGLYHWDSDHIDDEAFAGVTILVNLAGANLADARHTESRKKELIDSRVKSTDLLLKYVQKYPIRILVSASAIGIYPDGKDLVTEDSPKAQNFFGELAEAWERSALSFEKFSTRVVILRIGVVLAKEGGALPKMSLPVKAFVGAPLGDGNQMVSWIHIDDLVSMIEFAIENNELRGIYNAVAPSPVNNRELTKEIASALHRPLILPPVPSFVLKAALGGVADMVLTGSNVSCKKIQDAGFRFSYFRLTDALRNLLVD